MVQGDGPTEHDIQDRTDIVETGGGENLSGNAGVNSGEKRNLSRALADLHETPCRATTEVKLCKIDGINRKFHSLLAGILCMRDDIHYPSNQLLDEGPDNVLHFAAADSSDGLDEVDDILPTKDVVKDVDQLKASALPLTEHGVPVGETPPAAVATKKDPLTKKKFASHASTSHLFPRILIGVCIVLMLGSGVGNPVLGSVPTSLRKAGDTVEIPCPCHREGILNFYRNNTTGAKVISLSLPYLKITKAHSKDSGIYRCSCFNGVQENEPSNTTLQVIVCTGNVTVIPCSCLDVKEGIHDLLRSNETDFYQCSCPSVRHENVPSNTTTPQVIVLIDQSSQIPLIIGIVIVFIVISFLLFIGSRDNRVRETD